MKRNLSNLELVDIYGNKYSTTPGDYFMISEKARFRNRILVATERKDGCKKIVTLRREPTLSAMKKLKEAIG